MANVATMGPPPSPKEPRRSGRRTMPSASTSKSPAGSPPSDAAPKSKDGLNRPPVPSSINSSRGKRGKQEEPDETFDDPPKNGHNGNGNARAKRKGGSKDKDKTSPADDSVDTPQEETSGGDGAGQPEEEEEEEAGVTRCICERTVIDDDTDVGDFMIQCETCKTWQHGPCMGFPLLASVPQHYFCEICRPDIYADLLLKRTKKARQSSTNSHITTTAAGTTSRSSRSHSPAHQKTTKRRNTMNSRDAAYEESVKAIIEATAAEAAAAANEISNAPAAVATNGAAEKLVAEADQETEAGSNARKKRKRDDDEATQAKRTRSASTASDPAPPPSVARDATPVNGIVKPAPTPSQTAAKSTARNRRGGGRKSQAQELMSVEGDETISAASATNARRATTRAKASAAQDHRRAQPNASNATSSSVSRAYHNSHAYAASQQPLFTSWNLPDYLAHLEPMLPTNVPRPLEVRGSGIDATGRESLERMPERGVKIKWPSKRMSVGDMNKRVRALVEWVGREQANALERTRRWAALEKALRESQDLHTESTRGEREPPGDGGVVVMVDGAAVVESPQQQKSNVAEREALSAQDAGLETMKMMEELMEELISFQERFGPGAKMKERERRTTNS